MIKLDSLDGILELAGSLKELIFLVNNPEKLDEFVAGISEVKKLVAQKNEVINGLEAIDSFNKTKQAQIEAMDLRKAELSLQAVSQKETMAEIDAKAAALSAQDEALKKLSAELASAEEALAAREATFKDKEAILEAKLVKTESAIASAEASRAEYVTKLTALASLEGK